MIHVIAALRAIQAGHRCLTMAELRMSVSQSLRRSISIAPRAPRAGGETKRSVALDVAPSMMNPLQAGVPCARLSLAQSMIAVHRAIGALQA